MRLILRNSFQLNGVIQNVCCDIKILHLNLQQYPNTKSFQFTQTLQQKFSLNTTIPLYYNQLHIFIKVTNLKEIGID